MIGEGVGVGVGEVGGEGEGEGARQQHLTNTEMQGLLYLLYLRYSLTHLAPFGCGDDMEVQDGHHAVLTYACPP